MGRSEPTGAVHDRGLEHSVVDLPWGVLRGALGPSDGSAGAAGNVPSALAVLRHAALYLPFPQELDEAFGVLERHAIRHGQLYPVAVTILPFLFDILRRDTPVSERLTDIVAEYTVAAGTLEPPLRDRVLEIVADHGREIIGWLGRHDRGACAITLHVPAVREDLLAVVEYAVQLAPEVLLALIELDACPGPSLELARAMLDGADAPDIARMAAAAFLARFGERSPALHTRIDAALPPSAPEALRVFVGKLWTPTIDRPVVAPRLYDAEVVFAGDKLVLIRAGSRSVTLPWVGSNVERGDRIKVGITAHGQPKLVVVTDPDGTVRIIDF